MNIKYSKKKEELRKDPVLESIVKSKDFITENSNTLVTGFVVLVLIFGGFKIFSYVQKTNLLKAQNDFGKAMLLYTGQEYTKAMDAFKQVVEDHQNTSQATYSAFMAGHIYFAEGKYDEAIQYFEEASANKKNIGFICGESLEALGNSYESKGELEKSLEYFEKALNDKTIGYRIPAIRWKMALINKKLGNNDKTELFCKELVSDTLALEYRKKAENLLAIM